MHLGKNWVPRDFNASFLLPWLPGDNFPYCIRQSTFLCGHPIKHSLQTKVEDGNDLCILIILFIYSRILGQMTTGIATGLGSVHVPHHLQKLWGATAKETCWKFHCYGVRGIILKISEYCTRFQTKKIWIWSWEPNVDIYQENYLQELHIFIALRVSFISELLKSALHGTCSYTSPADLMYIPFTWRQTSTGDELITSSWWF